MRTSSSVEEDSVPEWEDPIPEVHSMETVGKWAATAQTSAVHASIVLRSDARREITTEEHSPPE